MSSTNASVTAGPPEPEIREDRLSRLGRLARSAMRLGAAALMCTALAGVAGAQTNNWPSERPPRSLPASDIKFPPYDVQTLPNGLQVVAVLHHEQPVVSMRLLIRTGSASDPRGKLGLVSLLASLLDQGTTTKSANQLADAIDFIGGSMGTGAGNDLTFINSVVMKDSFEAGLRMIDDMAERPAFAPDEIDRQRQQILSGLKVSLDDPDYLANAVFDRMVYGAHPYGMPENGTPESMAGITRADLLAFHQAHFVPNNAILAIVGDVTAEEAFNAAKAVFGSWKARDIPKPQFPQAPSSSRRVVVVDKPDAVQTEVRVGHIGIPRNHPDYMALNLAIRILGGEGSNRLHQVLRTERGLTYGAQAIMSTLKDSGDIEATTNTRTETTGEVLRLTVDEFWRLQRERVSDVELSSAKAYITGSYPLTLETPEAIAAQVLNAVFYGLPLEQLQTFRARVNAVTVDDIERVARFYLKPDAVSVVLVGNAAAFTPQLRGIGFGRYEVVPIGSLDLLTQDFKRTGTARIGQLDQPRVTPASFRPDGQQRAVAVDEGAKSLLDRVIAAKGGLATLEGLKTITAVSASTTSAPGGTVQAQTTTYLQYPDHVRVETKMPQGTQVQVYDGMHGWVRDPFGVREVPSAALREMDATLKRDTVAALVAAAHGELRARLLPDAKDEDGAVRRVLELSSPSLEPLVLYVDPETSRIAKQSYFVQAPGQPLIEEVFSDYRSVNGLSVAFVAEVRTGGKAIVERHLSDIKINAPLDPKLFTRPSS